jgi:RNA polymerase sigma-70 factor (ECF subfamily)
MQLRASGKDIVVIDDSFMESAQIPHQDIDKEIQEEKLQLLEKCIGELNPEQQQSVRLFYLEEKCYKDIAEMTGFDIKKVKSYIQNGRRNLKICMEKNHG